jgi:hypothetical protein
MVILFLYSRTWQPILVSIGSSFSVVIESLSRLVVIVLIEILDIDFSLVSRRAI